MKSILYWTLWQRRISILWWCVGVFALIFINLAFYPSIKDQAAQLDQSLAQIPESARGLFSDTADFLSPTGYLSSQIFYLLLPMLLTILAISLGSSLIAKEEQNGTLELLLSRPISRTKLLTSKLFSGLAICVLVGFVAGATSVIMAHLVRLDVPLLNILFATIATILLALSFGMLAFALTMFGKARGASIGLASLYALGGYVISSLTSAADWLKYPSKAFPFEYYQPAVILQGTYNWANMVFILGLIALLTVVSLWAFKSRDLN